MASPMQPGQKRTCDVGIRNVRSVKPGICVPTSTYRRPLPPPATTFPGSCQTKPLFRWNRVASSTNKATSFDLEIPIHEARRTRHASDLETTFVQIWIALMHRGTESGVYAVPGGHPQRVRFLVNIPILRARWPARTTISCRRFRSPLRFDGLSGLRGLVLVIDLCCNSS
jgi:hypothetical protein